jgi:hypothetical protein
MFSLIRSARNYRGIACALGIVGNHQRGRFNEGDVDIFRLKLWEIFIFELFLLLKIQLNFKKWFWKENLVG